MSKKKETQAKQALGKKRGAAEEPHVVTMHVDDILPTYTRETNPNKMSDEQFSSLVSLIKEEGFLQPLLVQPPDKNGKFKLIDGHHRLWAAQAAERTQITAVVKKASEPLSAALGIGMNKNRGELDLSISGMVMQHIMEDTGWTADQLALLTGFTQSEIEAITKEAVDDGELMLEDVGAAPPEEEEEMEGSAKPYVLEIRFADKATYQLARKKLRKAAGASKDLAVGLLAVLGEENESA